MRLAVKETETEDLFATLANKSPVGLCIIQDGKFCYTNPTFRSNTGYREDELLGRDSLELIVPEDRKMVKENAIKMLKGELSVPDQLRVIHKDGSIHWVVKSVSSVQYRGRRATLGTFIDITEHKEAEEALQVEKNKLQSLIDAMEDTVTIQDTEYNIIYQNEPSRIASGGDHVGEKCYRAYEGRETMCDGCPVEKAFKDGKSHTSERKTAIEGKVAFWENTANPVIDTEGRVVSCLELARDVTERKRIEEALRDSEEKLRKMFESVTDGILVIDLKGSITEVNQIMVEMHGFSSKDELLGKNAFDLVAPRDHKGIAADMKKAVKQEAIRGVEYTLLRADGSEFPGELSTNALKDASGNVVGHITIGRDITERRRAEEERKALLQDIAESNRRLEGANKELQDFVYVASHDLREPLRKISSFGTLLQDSLKGKLDEDEQENFEFMIGGAQRMQDMIEALLSYSRLTTRAKPPQQVFLNEVIENLKKFELATLLDETRGTIRIPEPLPPVQADPSQMNQLFQNLIGNGLKFHKEGIPPEIIIRAHGVENKMIRIEVEDNGIGIDEKYHEQLFVMFKRLHSRAQYEGTGIGLAICKKVVERHRGNIGIKSTPGKGSTFWFTLPRGSYLKEN